MLCTNTCAISLLERFLVRAPRGEDPGMSTAGAMGWYSVDKCAVVHFWSKRESAGLAVGGVVVV